MVAVNKSLLELKVC